MERICVWIIEGLKMIIGKDHGESISDAIEIDTLPVPSNSGGIIYMASIKTIGSPINKKALTLMKDKLRVKYVIDDVPEITLGNYRKLLDQLNNPDKPVIKETKNKIIY